MRYTSLPYFILPSFLSFYLYIGLRNLYLLSVNYFPPVPFRSLSHFPGTQKVVYLPLFLSTWSHISFIFSWTSAISYPAASYITLLPCLRFPSCLLYLPRTRKSIFPALSPSINPHHPFIFSSYLAVFTLLQFLVSYFHLVHCIFHVNDKLYSLHS